MDLRNAIQKQAERVAREMSPSDAKYVAQVRDAIESGATVHREILLDAVRLINPQARGARTEQLRQIILDGYDNGYRD